MNAHISVCQSVTVATQDVEGTSVVGQLNYHKPWAQKHKLTSNAKVHGKLVHIHIVVAQAEVNH